MFWKYKRQGVEMAKYQRAEKFEELDSTNNWAGFGKEVFVELKAGKSVECEPTKEHIEDGFVKPASKATAKGD